MCTVTTALTPLHSLTHSPLPLTRRPPPAARSCLPIAMNIPMAYDSLPTDPRMDGSSGALNPAYGSHMTSVVVGSNLRDSNTNQDMTGQLAAPLLLNDQEAAWAHEMSNEGIGHLPVKWYRQTPHSAVWGPYGLINRIISALVNFGQHTTHTSHTHTSTRQSQPRSLIPSTSIRFDSFSTSPAAIGHVITDETKQLSNIRQSRHHTHHAHACNEDDPMSLLIDFSSDSYVRRLHSLSVTLLTHSPSLFRYQRRSRLCHPSQQRRGRSVGAA